MKLVRGMIGVLGVLFSQWAFAETLTVKDINGDDVEISRAEIVRAYFLPQSDVGLNHQIPNGDGSVAIVNPVFSYAGKQIPYVEDFYASGTGICKHLGFTTFHGAEKVEVANVVQAAMNRDGMLREIRPRTGQERPVVEVVVCSNHS